MSAQLAPSTVYQAFAANGTPLASGKLNTYAAGTTTPQATYVDSTQTTQNTNPVILNASGQASVWLDPGLSYKFVLTDANGNSVPPGTVDNIQGALSTAVINVGSINASGPVVTGPLTVNGGITASGAVATGALTVNGIINASGSISTFSGGVMAASGVATTVKTIPNTGFGTYIVTVTINNVNDATNYSAVSLVSSNGTANKIISLQTAANMVISLSGANVQATQSSGISTTVSYSILRVA
jgi:hypothetical protein